MLTKQERLRLKKHLPVNYAELVAEKTGVKPLTVIRAVDGSTKKPKHEILQELITLAESEKLKKSNLKQKVKSL